MTNVVMATHTCAVHEPGAPACYFRRSCRPPDGTTITYTSAGRLFEESA